jgi:hypothetical protein
MSNRLLSWTSYFDDPSHRTVYSLDEDEMRVNHSIIKRRSSPDDEVVVPEREQLFGE